MSTAMHRATRRMRKQKQGVAMARTMGVVAGAAAPAAWFAMGGAPGLAAAAFLAFASFFLLVSTTQ